MLYTLGMIKLGAFNDEDELLTKSEFRREVRQTFDNQTKQLRQDFVTRKELKKMFDEQFLRIIDAIKPLPTVQQVEEIVESKIQGLREAVVQLQEDYHHIKDSQDRLENLILPAVSNLEHRVFALEQKNLA